MGRAPGGLLPALALTTPRGLRPALATPLQPNSSSVNPAWARQEVRGQAVACR